MAVDRLQDKIRKSKNPMMLYLCLASGDFPPHTCKRAEDPAECYALVCRELLAGLKGIVPAVRVSFSSFAIMGGRGLDALTSVLKFARDQGYYVALDAPEFWSVAGASAVAEAVFSDNGSFPCDAAVISGYPGSDMIKPFLPYCRDGKKDLFVVARTANKSASELQDLLSGSRLVHIAAADHVNRYGSDTAGKFGYTQVGILAAASAPDSLRSLRSKYPRLFMLLDGADYPNANAKNCSFGFDKFGHGAVAVVGSSVSCAWKQTESDGSDYVELAAAAAERMKKNLTRYFTIL